MRRESNQVPDVVWRAFTALIIVGAVMGILCGSGATSGGSLLAFLFGALAIFVPWAVWKLDVSLIKEMSDYRESRDR
jgi:hypothetical protein